MLASAMAGQGDRFAACLAQTLRWEGGYSNDPYDPGGATMCGVIQRVYDGFRAQHGLPPRHVREIGQPEIVAIYRDNYWRLVQGDELPAGVDLAVFDFGVNSGPARAIKALQRIVGVVADGHIGAATIAAARGRDPAQIVRSLQDERRRFVRQIKHYWRFKNGWERRIDGVEIAALAMTQQGRLFPEPALEAEALGLRGAFPIPAADPDTQSASQGRAVAGEPTPPVTTEIALGGTGSSSIVYAAPGIVQRSIVGGRFSATAFLLAIVTEPLFWVGVVTVVSAVYVYLWRKKHQ